MNIRGYLVRKTYRPFLTALLGSLVMLSPAVMADSSFNERQQRRLDDQQMIHRQEQQHALEQQLMPEAPDIRILPETLRSRQGDFPDEYPCFMIRQITLSGIEALPGWAQLESQRLILKARDKCLGAQGINQLMSELQDTLIDHGWITTRVLAPQQDLVNGKLNLAILPGRVCRIAMSDDSTGYLTLSSAMPVRGDDILDLRDVEQGLENLQRLPSVKATMELVPGEQPGESDLIIKRKQGVPIRFGAWVDDSGTTSTGQFQGGVMMAIDNPFSLSDLFYVSLGHDLSFSSDKHSRNYSGHYSVPYGYWLFGVTVSDYDYARTVSGINRDYRYSGHSDSMNAKLTRILHRGTYQKTSMTAELITRQSRNYIGETELTEQRRNTSAWRLGLTHRHYIGQSTVDMGATYQRGIRGFGAHKVPEEYGVDSYATAMSHIIGLSSQLSVPFTLSGQGFRYITQYQYQRTNTPLTPQDQFSIGGRWSVRGFDGERSLSADQGWYWRNELAWQTPLQQQELYIGVDHGEVLGRGTDLLNGTRLTGAVLGLRGMAFDTSYDVFAGAPISKPEGFKTSPVALGMSLNWQN